MLVCIGNYDTSRNMKFRKVARGDNGGGDSGDGGGIVPEHRSPLLHAPGGNISRKGSPSLRLYIYI